MFDLSTVETIFAAVVMVFGTARLTRIVAHDDYPPAEWVRMRWYALVGDRWGKLLNCIWCTQPYVAIICLAWAALSDLHWTWWVFWGWLALSQAGSTLLAYDEPAE